MASEKPGDPMAGLPHCRSALRSSVHVLPVKFLCLNVKVRIDLFPSMSIKSSVKLTIRRPRGSPCIDSLSNFALNSLLNLPGA